MGHESALKALEASRARLQSAISLSPQAKRLLSLGLSAAILVYLADAVSKIGWQEVIEVLPANPLFYLLVAVSYMATPVTEHIIFRRWWPLTPRALAVFSRKQVLNEAVLGYSGDAYLFMWARKAIGARAVSAGPLAAVKDVAITSALAGNVATLLLLALALSMGGGPAVEQAFTGPAMRSVGLGFAFVMAISLLILLFSRKLLSLAPRENLALFNLHMLRTIAATVALFLAWILALPEVAIGTWIVLGALRMVISRLPLVPNKELLFAAISVTLAGPSAPEVAALMAVTGATYLLLHAISFAVTSLLLRDAAWLRAPTSVDTGASAGPAGISPMMPAHLADLPSAARRL